jgi:hypothetical protein
MGLSKALQAQGKTDEAMKVGAEFGEAWRRADTSIKTSRL